MPRYKPYPFAHATDLHMRAMRLGDATQRRVLSIRRCGRVYRHLGFNLVTTPTSFVKLKMSKIDDCATKTSTILVCWFHERQVYTAQPKAYLLSPPNLLRFARHFTAAVLFSAHGTLLTCLLLEDIEFQCQGHQDSSVRKAAC